MSFICMRMKNLFHINGVEVSLALKQRLEATQKWPFSLRQSLFLAVPNVHILLSISFANS